MLTEMGWVSSYGLEISEGVCMVRFRALDATTDARCMFQKQKPGKFNSACSSAGEGTPGAVCNSALNLDTVFVEALILRCTFRCHAEFGLEPCGWMKPYVISLL